MNEARAPNTKEQAKQDYLKGMKYKDLAERYSVSLNTIKSWIKRYNWFKEKKRVHSIIIKMQKVMEHQQSMVIKVFLKMNVC